MKRKAGFLVAAAAVLVACVTINVYFPEAKIKDLSEEIEEQVRQQAEQEQAGEEDEKQKDPSESQGGQSSLFDALLGVTPAFAQDVPSPEASNPAIRKIIDSRAGRLAGLAKFFDTSVIGENNEGLVEIRDLDQIKDLRERAEVQKLVRSENSDREQLYKEIAAAENVELSQLPKIRETYASTLREKARPGWWIQMPDGSWKQK